ncbi:hypothetical protein [Micromonospora sp. NPDC005299]|uniref:hypothetical protein n=1 Tax=Micromonospora sp. NPDC005299 TaxID=3364231 RepID=UPI003681B588
MRHLGVSAVDAAQLAEARSLAPVAAVQDHFHVNTDPTPMSSRMRAGLHRVRAVLSARRGQGTDRPGPAGDGGRPSSGDRRTGRRGLAARQVTDHLAIPGTSSPIWPRTSRQPTSASPLTTWPSWPNSTSNVGMPDRRRPADVRGG